MKRDLVFHVLLLRYAGPEYEADFEQLDFGYLLGSSMQGIYTPTVYGTSSTRLHYLLSINGPPVSR